MTAHHLVHFVFFFVTDKIQIPLLCLSALDDPLVPETSIPYAGLAKNRNVALVTTAQGGHLAWVDVRGRCWMNEVIAEYVQHALQLTQTQQQYQQQQQQ